MRYFIHLGYDGKKYHGWQRQLKDRSVQETIETALSKMLHTKTVIFGCGRTDTGVHASQYILHLNADEITDYDPVFRLNKMLPDDIAVFDVLPANYRWHAQHDAIERTYDYFIHGYKDPFLAGRSSYYPLADFDLDQMKKAAALVSQYDDFRAFCKQPALYEHTRCKVTSAKLLIDEKGDKLRLEIKANRFLRGMIRKIVARLLEVGNGKVSLDQFEDSLKTGVDFEFKHSAYPDGLYLSKVIYPYLDLPARTDFWMGRETWKEV